MSDDRERDIPEEPVDAPDSFHSLLSNDAHQSDGEKLPDTAPLSDRDVTPILEEEDDPPVTSQADAPYQWNNADDVVWPVTYGEPLGDSSAAAPERASDADEFAMFGEETGDAYAAQLQPGADISAGTPEELAPVELRQPPSLFGWLRNLFAGASPDEQVARLARMNHAISEYPDLPANYVLRGELYLALGARAQAVSDFHTALDLAETQLEIRDWGIVAQTMRDRALVGLRKAGWRGDRKKRKMKPV